MRTFILVTWVALMILSIIARITAKRKSMDHPFVAFVGTADMFFCFVGLMLVGMANVGATNQFAKYMEGYPDVDAGGLPPEVLIGNLLLFALPLLIVISTRSFWRECKEDWRKIFADMTPP